MVIEAELVARLDVPALLEATDSGGKATKFGIIIPVGKQKLPVAVAVETATFVPFSKDEATSSPLLVPGISIVSFNFPNL